MPEIEIDNLDTIGVVRDEAAYQLNPEAWTRADNMRCLDGAMVRMAGNERVFGTPPVAPHFAMPISTIAQSFWLYASLAKIYAWDGTTHTNITRQNLGVDVDYTASQTRNWNGTILAGIPIFNNGADKPQFWAPTNLATKMQDLTNWPANTLARRLIAFGAYLVALNVTEGSNVYPHLVKWSSSVPDPGSLPASWDPADPTNDSGQYDLPDVNSGMLLEAAPLAGQLILYKEQSTWTMRRIGGAAVFSFDTLFDTTGILASRCVAHVPSGVAHLVATQDDLVVHSGQGKPESILTRKLRREIFGIIDTTNYRNSFCFVNPEFNEVWFCYPESGLVDPNRAVVFNAKTGAVTESDVAFRNVAIGVIESGTDEVWDAGSDTWDTETGTWNTSLRRRAVLCDPANTQFLQDNKGLLRNGASFDARLQRLDLSMIGRKRDGNWIVDQSLIKFVDRLWPKLRGGPIKMRIGIRDGVDSDIDWGEYQDFNPKTLFTFDEAMSGRLIAVEFFTDTPVDWALDGYKMNVQPVGNF